ncbi:MAG: hypothetical protein WAM06_12080 [Methyloceanibacter sp.]
MMRNALLLATGLWLAGAGLALPQAPDSTLPEGTFASTKEDCALLATKTPAELGEEFDFEVLTKKGLVGYQQVCDFVNVFAHDGKSWVATAFCEEAGYTYPDLFSIKQKDDGRLNVTRITDLTQQGGYDASAQSDTGETDAPEESGGAGASGDHSGGQSQTLDQQAASESYSAFVKCDTVKP